MEARPTASPVRPRARSERDLPVRDLRAERAAALARRGAGVAASDSGVDHLVCACGSERYGVPLAAVAQVLPSRPCTPMPGAVPALVGLVALSGRIVGVLSLARALGRPEAPPESGTAAGHLIVLRGGQTQPLALVVDRVLGIARAAGSSDGAATDPANPDGLGIDAASVYAPGAARDGSPDFVVIDLPRLLRRVLP